MFQRLAGRQLELGVQQVYAGDLLGDGVFDLNARVGFHKVKALRLLGIQQEFERTQALVLRRAG